MKKPIFFLALFLVLGNEIHSQSFRSIGYLVGGGILPLNKEFSEITDRAYRRNILFVNIGFTYSSSKYPIELFVLAASLNKSYGEFERDAVYEINGPAQASEFTFSSRWSNNFAGLNFFLFKKDLNLKLPPDENFSSSKTIREKKGKIFNPFIGIGVTRFIHESKLGMITKDYDANISRGAMSSLNFDTHKSYLFVLSGGFELIDRMSKSTTPHYYPSWDFSNMGLRFTVHYQRNPSVYIHTSKSLGQDFIDNYQPYMDYSNPNDMIRLPLSNWTFHLQLFYRLNLNSTLSRERRKNIEAQQSNQEEVDQS